MDPELPLATTLEVRDRCLCFRAQRAARALGRRFDAALKPVGLTNGQFSLLMSLNRPDPPRISDLAPFLAMDRTTLTAALKVLERRGLVLQGTDSGDRRSRRLRLSDDGRALLKQAVPIWRRTHAEIDAALDGLDLDRLLRGLDALGEI
ncbi:MarR family winged helix-turn-helix transcriptional regulator [Salipiger marinus]|jgi:DNA-binding MarR family transcriptional regulator|uniref:MarR family winged helix-turn-helix transcriptional regulator n=1 Tax=Salipiger marinus TaxID=555512 RepID=UPI001E328C22|nr:MarR family winged helix-turn-helix transcriptional regulator [Salipiger manganoxidans]MCD1617542.1 MarR family winged helix-turn-helix transcriptional regulator [Salipiger manganoxidans]MEB3419650.1 MarR family winged helix-turn-helix transcriptional regulator [Salipiger manganoxidans]